MKQYQKMVEWVLLGVLIRGCLRKATASSATRTVTSSPIMELTGGGKAASGMVAPVGRDRSMDEWAEGALFI